VVVPVAGLRCALRSCAHPVEALIPTLKGNINF
jgi:hypothetical protein